MCSVVVGRKSERSLQTREMACKKGKRRIGLGKKFTQIEWRMVFVEGRGYLRRIE